MTNHQSHVRIREVAARVGREERMNNRRGEAEARSVAGTVVVYVRRRCRVLWRCDCDCELRGV